MQGKFIWLNGELVEFNNLKLDLHTHALHYATSVFEGIRFYKSKPFKLKEHIKRLIKSAQYINLDVEFSEDELIYACKKIIEKNDSIEGYLRPLIFRGEGSLMIAAENKCHIAISLLDRDGFMPKNFVQVKPISLKFADYKKIPPIALPTQCKGGAAYMINSSEALKARRLNFDDALFLDIDDYIAEASTANIFFAKENQLFTPQEKNILNGITRQIVINIIKELGYEINIGNFSKEDLLSADEVFLTGTSIEIRSVNKIENTAFTKTFFTNKIYDQYYEMVNS